MRKTLLSISVLLLIQSCANNNGKNNASTVESNTTLRDSEVKNQIKIDSTEQRKIDSLSRIAWGDLLFGMSVEEAKKTEIFKGAFRIYKDNNSFKKYSLKDKGTRIKGTSPPKVSFFKERLYRVDIESHKETANYYDSDIKEIVFRLKSLIEKKYGNPDINNGFPSILKMRPNHSVTAYGWEVGNKYILIKVNEVYGGYEYKVKCEIINKIEVKPVNNFFKKKNEEANKTNNF